VASGGLSPADIAYPLRALFKDQRNMHIMMDEVIDVDLQNKNIQLASKKIIGFDFLIIAAGVRAVSLVTLLIEKYQIEGDNGGRIIVRKDCSLPNHPNVFAIGDMASFPTDNGDIFADASEKTPNEIIKLLKRSAIEWIKDEDQDDDITFVVIKMM
jgi:NADH dehydrogenase FAD-containing subunit